MPCDTIIISGNPRPQSTTLATAVRATDALFEAAGAAADVTVIELADIADTLLTWQHPDAESVRERVAKAAVVVVATPSYKGTYTGLLKAFLDGYGPRSLAGVMALPVAVAGSPVHAYTTQAHACTLLGEVGALTPFGGLGLVEAVAKDDARLAETLHAWTQDRQPLFPSLTAALA